MKIMQWKDVPHLFANGKFNVKSPRIITGKFDGIEEGEVDSWVIYSRGQVAMLDECTLIARKIEDITDEEIIESVPFKCLKDIANPAHIRMMEIDKNSVLRSGRMMLYMLSIGVYPFDQSHFETGEVIDIKTLTEEQK